jgi:hypothetical protein
MDKTGLLLLSIISKTDIGAAAESRSDQSAPRALFTVFGNTIYS